MHRTRVRVPYIRREPSQVSLALLCSHQPVFTTDVHLRASSNFLPDTGLLRHVKPPATSSNVRMDTGFGTGDEISVSRRSGMTVYPRVAVELTEHPPATGLLRSSDCETDRPRLVSSRSASGPPQSARRVPDCRSAYQHHVPQATFGARSIHRRRRRDGVHPRKRALLIIHLADWDECAKLTPPSETPRRPLRPRA
jgi:hypothetical protein